MLKARRKDQGGPLKFPEPRRGLPEDPRLFLGSHHLAAAAAVQEHLSSRCLVAVVGRVGSGKTTVCRRAANSRWARQWFLRDEQGQPVHRRFWVDLEDCSPGRDTAERVAHALGRASFAEALSRLNAGGPCLLVLDNADAAFSDGEEDETLAALVGCVERGASIVVTRRSVSGLTVGRRWTEVVDVSGFADDDSAAQLFVERAPQHAGDPRVGEVVAACDRLPLAVNVLGGVAADADLDVARLRVGSGQESAVGIDFALPLAFDMLEPEDRSVWTALSQFPAGLSEEDVVSVLGSIAGARDRAIHLYHVGLARRCEAGLRIPVPLRLSPPAGGLDDGAAELWARYVERARAVVGPVADPRGAEARGPGAAGSRDGTPGRSRGAERSRRGPPTTIRAENTRAGDWLVRQAATLSRLAQRPALPDGTFELACAGLQVRRSAATTDGLDLTFLRLMESSMLDVDRVSQAARAGVSLEDQRRFATSVLLATAVVGAYRKLGDRQGEAAALCQLGRAERFATRYHDALGHLTEALTTFGELEDGVGEGSALFELGQVDLDLGRLESAEHNLEGARARFQAHDRPIGEANANLELVRVDLAKSRLDVAEGRLGVAMERYQQVADALGYANACLQLGQVELARGRLDSAERHFTDALDNYEKAADKVGFANGCLQLGQVELARGRLDSAERRFSGALAGYELVGDAVGTANASLQLGQIDLARNRLPQAGQRLRTALAAYEQLGDRLGAAHASLQLGQVHLGQGDVLEAERHLRAARYAYDDIGDPLGSANSRQVGAVLHQVKNEHLEAMVLYGEAARLYDAIGRTANAAWSLAGAARTCTGKAERMGYAADAVRHLRQAGFDEVAVRLEAELAEPEPASEPHRDRATEAEPATDAAVGEPALSVWPHHPSEEAVTEPQGAAGRDPLPPPGAPAEVATDGPEAEATEQGREAPQSEERSARRKSRFRWGRKNDRPAEQDSLPRLERDS